MGDKIDNHMSDSDISKTWDYWYPLVFGFFYRRLNSHEDVEELTANTITALIMNPDVRNPQAYVWQTARQQLYKFIDQKTKTASMVEFDEQTMTHLEAIDYRDMPTLQDEADEYPYSEHYNAKIAQLMECVQNHLSEYDYELVKSAIVDEKNSTQIGEALQCKPGTVRQRLKRAIDKLRKYCV